ncbi:MAG: hypothetical protein KDC45_04860 [Bacteroidetes bacterium]|nr:hypothetical protein [Bacteroidota bacterium]
MAQGTLSREYKIQLIKNVYDDEAFDEMIEKASPYELADIHAFLWDAVLYVGCNEDGGSLTREAITARMVPTTEYWRAQLCGEPLDTCRGRSCYVSHPVCAGNKLKGQIKVIRQFFDRRKQRAAQNDDGLLMLMMHYVNKKDLAAVGLYDTERKPKLTVGSRLLDGDELRYVIQAMNVAVAQNYTPDMRRPVIIGSGTMVVRAWNIFGAQKESFILALTAPQDTPDDDLNQVVKKIESGVGRIQRSDQKQFA